MAFSLTGDAGCENGGGVNCTGNHGTDKKQSFLGYMFYNRFWFHKDRYGLTLGGGKINNPGRYLVLLPPINGATAATGTPYFTENPGDPFQSVGCLRRHSTTCPASTLRSAGSTTIAPRTFHISPAPGALRLPGGNTGAPGSIVPGFTPDLRKIENRIDLAILVKF